MIYDCFPFNNELDILELRLEMLGGVVDRFVLSESTKTHTGHDKPLHFSDNRGRFAKYLDRIVHVVVRDNPSDPDPWVRERFQREQLMTGLVDCKADDVILISDLDEIPDPALIVSLAGQSGVTVFEQHNCCYFMNLTMSYWHGTRALRYDELKAMGPNAARQSAGRILPRAGWHFSYLGGTDTVLKKLSNTAHQEYNTEHFSDRDRVAAAIETGSDLFSRTAGRGRLLQLTALPKAVQADPERFRPYLTDRVVREAEFHEDWYPVYKLRGMMFALGLTHGLSGRIIEIGCWEGRSTSYLARAAWPDLVNAVDTWEGNDAESDDHPSVVAAKQRNVFRTFLRNMFVLTRGNVRPQRMRSTKYLEMDRTPIRFAHIDASHDYPSVKTELLALLPLVVDGGVLCGDDFEDGATAAAGLDGGVERAVREVLPGCRNDGSFWWWQKGRSTPPLGGLLRRLSRRVQPSEWKRNLLKRFERNAPSLYAAAVDWWWARQARKRLQSSHHKRG